MSPLAAPRFVMPRARAALPLALVAAVLLAPLACTRKADDRSARSASGSAGPAPDVASAPPAAPMPLGYAKGVTSEAASEAVPATVADASLPIAMTGSASRAQLPATPPAYDAPTTSELLAQAMVIRTGTATLEVTALDTAIARLRYLAQRHGGYVGDTQLHGGRDQPRSATLELKLPAQRFDDAVGGLSPLGKVESVEVSAEDVGEEFVDVQARVANGRRLEERLVRLLEDRTGRLQDALQVERELARVREEIERYEGRMRYLKTRASVSTLSVTLHEPLPILADRGPHPIRDAFGQAWRNFVGVLAGLIASLGVLVPLALLAVLSWLGLRRLGVVRTSGRPATPAS